MTTVSDILCQKWESNRESLYFRKLRRESREVPSREASYDTLYVAPLRRTQKLDYFINLC